jgi:1-deoxy-D-xylulose-5-phosphate synthase
VQKNILDQIKSPEDLKNLSLSQLLDLSQELRNFVINIVATKEGHLGASLGVVELSIALHKVFDTPEDRLIWDVGHQAYIHKILTGRKDVFHTNRQYGGIAGFPKRTESVYDNFGTGHSSTSISAALGMAIASKISGNHSRQHIAIIGDASIASGMAFEALNHAGVSDANLLIVLNDNEMGIDPNVGAFKDYLTKIKNDKDPSTSNIFDNFSIDYFGPIDGHNLPLLLEELERLKQLKGPRLLHVVTTKGKGLVSAEQDQITFHAPGKFNPETGQLIKKEVAENMVKFQDIFGKTLVELGESNSKIVGITPAMPTGSSLKYFIEAFPERSFDVGISEQHAVTLAAGLACEGMIPFVAIYSTFLQRAYDQVIHDVAIQNLPVIFCIDRAGIVGEDGPTHHGVFDISYLLCIPNLIIYAPATANDLRDIMYTASQGLESPIAIRYPRGYSKEIDWNAPFKNLIVGKAKFYQHGTKIAVISVGTANYIVQESMNELKPEEIQQITHLNLGFIKPLDVEALDQIFESHSEVICIEDGSLKGGASSSILEFYHSKERSSNTAFRRLGIPDEFVSHGKTDLLRQKLKLDAQSLTQILIKSLDC